MPSFLNGENSPAHWQSSAVVHLDPALQYGLSPEKVNGHTLIASQSQSTTNGSFDESSTHSTQTSDLSEHHRPHLNGDRASPRSMNHSLDEIDHGGTNGVPEGHSPTRKPPPPPQLPNGLPTMTLPDRSLHLQPPAKATKKDADLQNPRPGGAHSRNSLSSGAGGSIQQSPVEMYMQPVNKGDVRTVDSSPPAPSTASPNALPSSTASLSPSSSAPHATPSQDANLSSQHPPHRFSSPPLFHQSPASPTSSGTLHPPAGTGLKQRHTLEVPKIAPGRGSRDGIDSALASGRFSPTTATTAAVTGTRRASLSLARRNTRSLHSDMPRDEVVPDEDALRWAEAYRQKRASKRKRVEREDDDRVLVGTKVDESHANWVTAYNMLTGIRVSVSRTNAKLNRPLTDADFEAKQKSTFDIAGNELVPSAKYDFKFKDYAPWVFRHLRALFRIDPADYLMSLTGNYILSELGSPGKSGSFFYFSRDYKYIIKTIHHSEHKFLRKTLKDYYQHVIGNPNTLLSQFYGLHRVKLPYGKKIHFVIMNNLFPPHRDIHQTFDLKGSTIGRDFVEDDLDKNPRATLKDLNWLRRQRHLELGLQKKKLFLDQLHKDVRLLQRLEIMDYSLLVGIHDLGRGNEENLRDKTLRVFNPGGDVSEEIDPHSVLMRTPSKLENQRKARELRQMIKSERPIPMGQSNSRMPNELDQGHNRLGFVFNQDDGGLRATHEDNTPADEIYYLGIIDCLTHYGIIKKIEHFWKGLSSDRSQISALPPHEYAERFINFIAGATMSVEEAIRKAQERNQAAAAAAAASEEGEQVDPRASFTGHRPAANEATTPSPLSPSSSSAALPSGQMSPEADATVRRATREAYKTDMRGASDQNIPDRTLKTSVAPAPAATAAAGPNVSKSMHGASAVRNERHESITSATQGAILPVVEEATEGLSTAAQSRNSHISSLTADSDGRPLTPAKDGDEREAGFGNPLLGSHRNFSNGRGPPTPPKTGNGQSTSLKPQSADSGYGVTGGCFNGHGLKGSTPSLNVPAQISRDSLDKALPPLPRGNALPQGTS